MSCPVKIHKLTEESPGPDDKPKCPVAHDGGAVDLDNVGDEPSLSEYKKLRQVMGTITRFYRDGSDLKKRQLDLVRDQMLQLDLDLLMCRKQRAALEAPRFRTHPKAKEYRDNLNEDESNLLAKRAGYESQEAEFAGLHEWSLTIVDVCVWLEANLDQFCEQQGMAFPDGYTPKKADQLTEEQIKVYARGLAEITYNLQESQDFFEASVDGRLHIFHELEKEIIEAQLAVLAEYPADGDRRVYWQGELEQDKAYVEGNMEEKPGTMARRQKMLTSHRRYLQVLRYHKDKLKALRPDLVEEEVQYDPKYNIYSEE